MLTRHSHTSIVHKDIDPSLTLDNSLNNLVNLAILDYIQFEFVNGRMIEVRHGFGTSSGCIHDTSAGRIGFASRQFSV